jgi:hypothetical protein
VLKNAVQSVSVWLTALCLLVQSVGAAGGGVLCLGCANIWGGFAVAAAPCTPASECCAAHADARPTHSPTDAGDDEKQPRPGCGCFDVTLSPNAGTLAKPPAKLVLSSAPSTIPAAVLAIEADGAIEAGQPWSVRDGPPIVRLLSPSARRTVLLI